MLNQAKHTLEERLARAAGDKPHVKILSVRAYQPGTGRRSGDIIAEAIALVELRRFSSEHDV